MHLFPTVETFFGLHSRDQWATPWLLGRPWALSASLTPLPCCVAYAQRHQTAVTAEVYSVNLNISFSFSRVLFFFQIAFSQHNSIMDLVQFFVTFFRWVSRRYTRWQLPQVRPPTPTPHPPSTEPTLHICSAAAGLWGLMWLQKSPCVLSSAWVHLRVLWLRVLLRWLPTASFKMPMTFRPAQKDDVIRESSALPWRLCVSHLSCSWAAALQLKILCSSGLSVCFLPVLCNLKCMFFLC